MKKPLSLIFAMLLACLALPAMADVTIDAVVKPDGMVADTLTITLDGPALANYYYEYHVEVVGYNGNTPLTVHRADYADNTVTLHVDEFSASSSLIVKCIDTFDPNAEEAGSSGGSGGGSGGDQAPAEEAPAENIVFSFEGDQITVGSIALEDKFSWGKRTFSYTKDGETLEQEYVYRLYTPENAEGPVPLVITVHGSGECGSDGKLMLTANGQSMCWADPAWQAERPVP